MKEKVIVILDEMDAMIMRLEDVLHGEEGRLATSLRHSITEIKNEIARVSNKDKDEEAIKRLEEVWGDDKDGQYKALYDYHKNKHSLSVEEIKFLCTRFAHECRLKSATTNNDSCNVFDKWIETQPNILNGITPNEVQIICEALTHLQQANVEYLNWKTDKYSQEQIPIHLKEINEVYNKMHKIRG